MKVNPDKCHILLNTKNPISVLLEGACTAYNLCEKLLGITIDSDLKFGEHISDLCNKVNKNINALFRVTGYVSLEKCRIVIETFVELPFNMDVTLQNFE